MDEKGSGSDDGEQKTELIRGEISGIFSVDRVMNAVGQHRDEIAQDAYNAVAYQELCGRRAEIRNDFRSWAERVPFLAKTFKVDVVPAMTPQDIAHEEQRRIDRKALRIARKHKNDPQMQAVHNYVRVAAAPLRDSTQVELEEKAKYLGGKLRHLFLRGKFSAAVNFFHEHTDDFPHPYEAEVFADVVYEECRYFLRWLKENAQHHLLPDALEAVSQMTKLEREDFYFMRENVQSEEEKKVFEDKLCEALKQHPAIYIRMRAVFVDLEFIHGPGMDSQPKIQAAITTMLAREVQKDPEIYFAFLRQLHDAGIVQGDEIHQRPEIQQAIEKGLVKAMKVGPIAYILLRNRMNRFLLIDDVDYNYNEKIQDASVKHFENWYGAESKYFHSFVYFLRRHGVNVPDGFQQRSAQKMPWHVKLWHTIKDNLVDADVAYFEEFLQQCDDFDEHFLQEERRKIVETLREFAEKYPMFSRRK